MHVPQDGRSAADHQRPHDMFGELKDRHKKGLGFRPKTFEAVANELLAELDEEVA